jgi:FtsP/CotA-like multicopper oxidase with cupredoxin domain
VGAKMNCRFGYHCHALDHEDKDMMGVIEVVG